MSAPVIPARIAAAHEVSAGIRRLVLAGTGLDRLAGPAGALGPYVKLHLPDGPRTRLRTYSVRRWDAARCELHLDVLLHPGGLGSDFAVRARAGDPLGVSGPGFIPARPHAAYLLAGDDTALPAITHILEHLPAACAVRAIVELSRPCAALPLLCSAARLDLAVLRREPGAPSCIPALVEAALREPAPDRLVWAGAEAEVARAVRAACRSCPAGQPASCQIVNYWRRGLPEGGFSYMD